MEYAKIIDSSSAINKIMIPKEIGLIAINIVKANDDISIMVYVRVIL